VKAVLVLSALALLRVAPAAASDAVIQTAEEAQISPTITPEDFNGGVAQSDVHDGGAVVIQMLQNATATGGATVVTPGPFVGRTAISGGH